MYLGKSTFLVLFGLL